jgi:type II secretory pathway predicted ATPase ExeA/outer membrane biosynthesis protein TonB
MVGARWAVENSQGMAGDSASWYYGARFLEEVLFDTILAIDMGSPTFLLGPKGSGKTTLARQAALRLRSRYHVAWLEGYPKLNLGQVTDACRRNFDPKTWEGVARGRTGAIQAGTRPSDNLLIVEHAEAISPRFLEQLVAVSNGCEKTMPSHRILLTGDVALGSLIGVSHLQNNWGPPVALRLSAWPDEAVAPFLRHRLSCAGAAPSDVLTDATLAHIANAAGGNPQRMLELARDELQQLRRVNADRDIDSSIAPPLMRSPNNDLSWVVSFDEPRKSMPPQPPARRRARAAMVALTGFAVAGALAVWSFERTRPPGVPSAADTHPAVVLAVTATAPVSVAPPEPAAVELHPPAPAERIDPVPSIAEESEVAAPLAPLPTPPPPPEPEQPVATAAPAAPPVAEPEPPPLPAATVAAPTVTATIQAPPAAPPPAEDARPTLSPSAINDLIDRGNVLLRAGDFAAARLFYVQAARAGSGKANTAVAWTYDPLVLDHMGVISNHGDTAKAIEWYRRALALGDEAAAEPLRRLSGP